MQKTAVGLVGPSGVGATSYGRRLARHHNFQPCPVVITRPQRADDGQHVHVVTCEEFLLLRESGALLESDQYMGNWYGSSRDGFEQLCADRSVSGVFFDLTPNGARQLKVSVPWAIIIALIPDNISWLEQRIRGRATDAEEVILARTRHQPEYFRELLALGAVRVTCYGSSDTLDATFAEITKHVFG